MCSTMKIAILVIGLIVAVSSSKLPLAGQHRLMDFMVKTRDVSHENPARSLDCFDYYVPVLNGITADYESSYAACLLGADEARQQIDNSTQPQRDQIESNATAACDALSKCSSNTGSIDYFECYANTGSDNAKIMYTISANASEILAFVREQYHLIQNQQYKCTNASERAYVESTASTYEELQMCLMGLSPVPSTTAPTTTTTHASTGTHTEPASTDAPTTTGNPTTGDSTANTGVPITTNAPTTTDDTTVTWNPNQ